MFNWLKNRLGSKSKNDIELPDIPWVTAEDGAWNVPVLDVRPVTQSMLSMSKDPQLSANAVSYSDDDGLGFVEQAPKVNQTISVDLRFPIDRVLADGALFRPTVMEHKWALYFHRQRVICVNGWKREVSAVAETEQDGAELRIHTLHGTIVDSERGGEEIEGRALDYLIRSHALDEMYPVPLPSGMEAEPAEAAMWCMNHFGNRAYVATHLPVPPLPPEGLLRTDSLLHIAAARGDKEAVRYYLEAGLPVDLLAGDGLTTLHWALRKDKPWPVIDLLRAYAADIDLPSAEGVTPLMSMVQAGDITNVLELLKRGAEVNAQDSRGFTALHRAAEVGHIVLVRRLIADGAYPCPEVDGHTPLSLAEQRGHREIVALLKNR